MTPSVPPPPSLAPGAVPRPGPSWRALLFLAFTFTLLNCFKPLHMDDVAFYYYASQIAAHPTDPYGFDLFWDGHVQSAFDGMAPPLLPYWLAATFRLCGDRPFLWKLGLLPFAVFLVFALAALARRCA